MEAVFKVIVAHNGLEAGQRIIKLTDDVRTMMLVNSGILAWVEDVPLRVDVANGAKRKRRGQRVKGGAEQGSGEHGRVQGRPDGDSPGGAADADGEQTQGQEESSAPVGVGQAEAGTETV